MMRAHGYGKLNYRDIRSHFDLFINTSIILYACFNLTAKSNNVLRLYHQRRHLSSNKRLTGTGCNNTLHDIFQTIGSTGKHINPVSLRKNSY